MNQVTCDIMYKIQKHITNKMNPSTLRNAPSLTAYESYCYNILNSVQLIIIDKYEQL